jgi:hypothetical protein
MSALCHKPSRQGKGREMIMPTFLITSNLTEQGSATSKRYQSVSPLRAKPPRNSGLRSSRSI